MSLPTLTLMSAMKRQATFLIAALVLIAFGCTPAEAPPDEDAGAATSAEDRTLAAPPDLQLGEWWTVEVRATHADATYRTTMVVAERGDGTATIGIPPEEFTHDFLVLHIPPLGDVGLDPFSWMFMWEDFEALRFPLEQGRAWSAEYHGLPVEAEVTGVEGTTATVTMAGTMDDFAAHLELTYDAETGMITRFQDDDFLGTSFRVLDHGFGYEGPLRTPTGIELGFYAAGVTDEDGHHQLFLHEETVTSMEVQTRGSHGSLGLVMWNVGHEEVRGTYRVAAIAPDGTRFEETFTATPDAPPFALRSFGHDVVGGTWEFEFEGEGPALFGAELFTYDMEEIRIENGR